ncbi:RalA-binding protein 1 [Trichoplax sp. H2]|uniref:Rho-GAP domain-containing protein n=1 Tax=Trichoplax adhaerens TaxID=10228 RepID=B3S5I4_TRIAD|nr:hypothetical protein TRIADDRAFT_59627 [Trichoplax adhaerens]EDV22046.1 hypothetical protein TRIADDRAFT_59627 [Trichoplax adhaerens]RDD41273.1 RalA-binding protein 1 [Trichoplax sp. H2]|eukprot:XP_002115683.1 hypothetical protein TRIADDRAFT_59627 [Trichoplax adhaerens]
MAVNRKGASRLHTHAMAETETLTMDSDDEDCKLEAVKFRDDDEDDGNTITKGGKSKKKTAKVKKSSSFVKNLMRGRFKVKKPGDAGLNTTTAQAINSDAQPVFGVPLEVAIERSSNTHNICLPRVIYECIQYLERTGIHSEGIYRVSGTKSKIMAYRAQYDSVGTIDFSTADPDSVAGLLKLYLRELPCNLLTSELSDKFEEASAISLKDGSWEPIKALVQQLPLPNRTLICWIIKHVANVIKNESVNKMTLPNMVIVLGPTLHLPTPVITAFLNHADEIFSDIPFEASLQKSAEETVESLNKTIAEVESQLDSLHDSLRKLPKSGKEHKKKSELLWAAQRKLTELSRQRRLATKVAKSLDQAMPLDTDKEKLEDDLDSVPIAEDSCKLENQELLLLHDELQEMIDAEKKLIENIKEEIATLTEQLKENSDAAVENGDEMLSEAEQQELHDRLSKENQELELHLDELFTKIHEQRQACIDLKVQIKLLEKEQEGQLSVEEATF